MHRIWLHLQPLIVHVQWVGLVIFVMTTLMNAPYHHHANTMAHALTARPIFPIALLAMIAPVRSGSLVITVKQMSIIVFLPLVKMKASVWMLWEGPGTLATAPPPIQVRIAKLKWMSVRIRHVSMEEFAQ